MSDDKFSEIVTLTASEIVSCKVAPVTGVLRVLGAILERPNLDAQAVAYLQQDIVRLYRNICAISDSLRTKPDVNEVAELVTQVTIDMGRTASREKRRLLANVLVNGLKGLPEDGSHRLFLRAVADFDVDQIGYLRCVEAGQPVDSSSPLVRAVHMGLVGYGFITGYGFIGASPSPGGRLTQYDGNDIWLSPCGEMFMRMLREPEP